MFTKVIAFVRRVLGQVRKWFLSREPANESSRPLPVYLGTQLVYVEPVDSMGLGLKCCHPTAHGFVMIRLQDVAPGSEADFWAFWKRFNAAKQITPRWEDGEVFDPLGN